MAAESGGGDLLKVLGEYGVFLVEMGSLKDIYGAVRASSRIKYTCISVGKKFIAVGATSGGIYLYNKKTLEYFRLITTKDGAITKVCFAMEKNYLGFATSNGIVLMVDVGSRTRDKPKYLRRSEEHKSATVTSLCWDDSDSRLFASDDRGFVTATYVPTKFGSNTSHAKRGLITHNSVIVGKSETAINQIDYAAEKLLISTMTKTAVLDLATLQCWLIGSKPRDGKFGACFLKQFNQESATVYTSRPGSRLWEAGMDGQVISTQQYKHLLAVSPSPVLGYGHTAIVPPINAEECEPKSFNFPKLLLIRDRFLLTWVGADVFLLDPVLGQLTGWYQFTQEISDVCCYGNQFYAYHEDGQMTWFGVLTVKETVARLFELNDFYQCSKVALECKSYLIPSTARDWVPISMVTALVKSIQGQPEAEELVMSLQDLGQLLQEDTSFTLDKLPGFYGDSNMIDSPETMSICSDVCSHHMDSGLEDDDNLSINQNDTKSKKENKEFSLENALFSVAVKAKRFAEERKSKRKFNLPNFKRLSSDTEKGMLDDERSAQEPKTPSALDEGASYAHKGTHIPEELKADSDEMPQSVLSNNFAEKTVAKDSVFSSTLLVDSDDNDSRCEDDIQDLKKMKEKTKKKKKKKVITVDINTPTKITSSGKSQTTKSNESLAPMDNMQFRIRSQSERDSPMSPIIAPRMIDAPSELPPAIPAMLSKAKGMIKRKLKETASDSQRITRSQSVPTASTGEVSESEDEDDAVEVPCPLEVEDLAKATCRAREHIQSPLVLYNKSTLQHTLQEWLPALFNALRSCKEMSRPSDAATSELASSDPALSAVVTSHNPTILLKNHLGGEVYTDVCLLAKMCLEIGVFYTESDDIISTTELLTVRNSACCSQVRTSVTNCNCDKVENGKKWENGKSGREPTSCTTCEKTSESSGCVHEDNSCSCEKTEKQDKHLSVNKKHELSGTSGSDRTITNTTSPNDNIKNVNCNTNDNNEISHGNCLPDVASCSPDHSLATKVLTDDNLRGDELSWSCSSCSSKHFNSMLHASLFSSSQASINTERKTDKNRALFLNTCFTLLNVQDIRHTLSLKPGIKRRTWKALLDCIKEFSEVDDITNHIKDGHVTRALHMLHDGVADYQDVLLLHLNNLYEKNGRETLNTCARMFPDVLPWEVMEVCRQGVSHDPQASAQYFMYYVEQLIRWRASIREKRSQIIKSLSKDKEFMKAWFHSALIASKPDGQQHCECGLPRPGSHRLPWKHEEHLREVLEIICEQPNFVEIDVFLNMAWKHGYWPGFLQLCSVKGYRHLVLESIVCLGDVALLDAGWPWGPTPQSIDEWRLLLELVALKSTQQSQPSTSTQDSDWMPNMTWENVLHLALKRLGPSRLVPLLQDVPYQRMSLPVEFYYKCVMGVVIERERSNLVHQMLTKVDTYLWSKRAGVLSPQMNYSRIEEQNSTSKTDKSSIDSPSMSHLKTLEDSATNWGVNIHLAEAICPVCTLHLSEQVSSSNQGLLVFECGHVYHKYCVPEHACVVCFHQNLKTLGKTRRLIVDSSMKIK